MELTPIPRTEPRSPTPTEKKYLLFLSPRTPRPKQADRPSPKVLMAMEEMGWIAAGPPKRIGIQDAHITPHGEEALNIEEDKQCKERGRVEWRVIPSMPEQQRVLITDGQRVTVGLREGDVIHAGVSSPLAMWLMWAPMPSPPMYALAYGILPGREP